MRASSTPEKRPIVGSFSVVEAVPEPEAASSIATEVLGVVATPTFVPPAPTPTLTASRVVVHASGDWIIDGDEVVTVHNGPAGPAISAVAVGVKVTSTGNGRVLADTTWIEVELPDSVRGYVRSRDLRIGQPDASDDAPSLLAARPDPVPTVVPAITPDLTDPPAPTAVAAAEAAPDPVPPVSTEALPATFAIDGWDPAVPTYSVDVAWSKVWLILGEELVRHTTLPQGHQLEVLGGTGRNIGGMALVPVRDGEVDAWMDIRTLRPAS